MELIDCGNLDIDEKKGYNVCKNVFFECGFWNEEDFGIDKL